MQFLQDSQGHAGRVPFFTCEQPLISFFSCVGVCFGRRCQARVHDGLKFEHSSSNFVPPRASGMLGILMTVRGGSRTITGKTCARIRVCGYQDDWSICGIKRKRVHDRTLTDRKVKSRNSQISDGSGGAGDDVVSDLAVRDRQKALHLRNPRDAELGTVTSMDMQDFFSNTSTLLHTSLLLLNYYAECAEAA